MMHVYLQNFLLTKLFMISNLNNKTWYRDTIDNRGLFGHLGFFYQAVINVGLKLLKAAGAVPIYHK